MAAAQTRYASGAAAPSDPATLAGSRKIPPPMVMLMIAAASPNVPIARTSDSRGTLVWPAVSLAINDMRRSVAPAKLEPWSRPSATNRFQGPLTRNVVILTTKASAATLSARLGIPRQKINYHLRALEDCGLVRVAEERRWGGLIERVMVASAASYVVSPAALGPAAADTGRSSRLSASYLIALAARVVREVSDLTRRARAAGTTLATLSLDTELRFRSPADRAAFARALTDAVTALVARYHDAEAPAAGAHRVVILAHPLPPGSQSKEE